jgi:hypothetical protein
MWSSGNTNARVGIAAIVGRMGIIVPIIAGAAGKPII